MRFLIDNALSPVVGEELNRAGHDAGQRELGLQAASDQDIFDHAAQDGRVIVSADTDLGTLLATRKETAPSVVLFRHGSQHRPADQAALLKANLPQLADALETGSIRRDRAGTHPDQNAADCALIGPLAPLPVDASSGDAGGATGPNKRGRPSGSTVTERKGSCPPRPKLSSWSPSR